MSVIDEKGKSIELFSLWSTRKVVLVFTRHMGCRFCKEQVSELKKIQPTLIAQGISVGIITVGKYEDIPRFKSENSFDGDVYVDSSLFLPECYKTMKLANGLQYLMVHDDSRGASDPNGANNILPETLAAAGRAVEKGFQDGGFGSADSEFTGDTLQIGGIFVLGPGNSCDYSYRCSFVGDLVDLGKVVTAATGKNELGNEVFYSRTLGWNSKLNTHAMAETLPVSPRASSTNITSTTSTSVIVPDPHVAVGSVTRNFTIGLAVIAMVVGVVAQDQRGRKAEVDWEVLLLAAAAAVAVLIVVVFVVDARRWLQAPLPSPAPSLFTSALEATPASKTSQTAPLVVSTVPTVGGRTLFKLSEIDQMVLRAAGEVDCDCAFLEDVDMINMTERDQCPVPQKTVLTSPVADPAPASSVCPVLPPPHAHTSPNPSLEHTSGVALSSAELVAAQSTLCYVREFLAKPNPHLGRAGPTCPFVPKSLQLDSIYLCVLPAAHARRAEDLDPLLLDAIHSFKALEPKSGPKVSFKAIILIFPDMELSEIPEMIDGTQKRLKPKFVEEGLMLGEFHLHNNATGLHNDHFYPLRTPYPCLAIRHMVPSDVVFLNPVEFPADVRRRMLTTFVSRFGEKASNDAQTEVARKLLRDL